MKAKYAYAFMGVFLAFSMAFIAAGSPRAYGQALPNLSITPQSLPDGTVNVPYSVTLTLHSDQTIPGPFYWSLFTGTLPTPLQLDATSEGAATVLSGTPDTPGDYAFTISATNHQVAIRQNFVIHINAAGTNAAGNAGAGMNINTNTNTATTNTAPAPAPATATTTNVASSSAPAAITTSTPSLLLAQLRSALATIETEIAELERSGSLGATSGTNTSAGTPGLPNTGGTLFYRNLTTGDRGPDVQALQSFLNSAGDTVAVSGAGSPGSETQFFGARTAQALARWQQANGISPASGYFGPSTRAAIESAMSSGNTGTGTQ